MAEIPDRGLDQVIEALRDCLTLVNPVTQSERHGRVFGALVIAEQARRGGGAGVREPRRPNPSPPSLDERRDPPE